MKEKKELYAAVDLGSNSFHMIVGEMINNQLHIIDSHKDMVRLANGLNKQGYLSKDKIDEAIESLQKIGQRIKHIPKSHLRIVGTNTLRKAKNSAELMARAEIIVGKPIDIISGREEARILYLGVAHSLPNKQGKRLVIDIGGGSTELIIGEEFKPLLRESLHMGCVSFTRKYFADDEISVLNWDNAVLNARRQLTPIIVKYLNYGWDIVIGASGTMRAAAKVIIESGLSVNGIDKSSLQSLIDQCLQLERISHLQQLQGLSSRRAPVFIGGLAIIEALFLSFSLDGIASSTGALREGIVYDLSGRLQHNDVRKRTTDKLCNQFTIDKRQSLRVKKSIDYLIEISHLSLSDSQQNLLTWAAQLHELGLNISHSHFEKHAAYILINADMPGFSNQEQIKLAVLVALQRRKIKKDWLQKLSAKQLEKLLPLIIILRLAVLFNRPRMGKKIELEQLTIKKNQVSLRFKSTWLKSHPLTSADLQSEAYFLQVLNIDYKID